MTRGPGRAGPAGSQDPQGPAARSGGTTGPAGLAAIGISVACTFAVAVAGPSVMEPALPGRPGTPP